MRSTKDWGEWLKLLSDEERAKVMQTQVVEEEKTKRVQIETDAVTKRNHISAEGYNVVRFFAVLTAAGIVIATAVTINHWIDIRYPAASATPAVAPASSSAKRSVPPE